MTAAGLAVQHRRAVDRHVLDAVDLQRGVIGTEVDREAARARRLAADRAIAAHERHGLARLDAEAHGLAVAGSFQKHDDPPWRAT
jgi:hypothetical protein